MNGPEEARERLAGARAVTVLTGAGLSAASGVPTFRGPEGMWRKWRPEQLATPEAFTADPALVWEWYHWRRGLIAEAEPNAAHRALAALEQSVAARGGRFALVTQNVDGLHDRAGSRRIVKIHGDLWTVRCTRAECGWAAEERRLLEGLVHCPRCRGLARPGVVWFGEALPQEALEAVGKALDGCDLFLVAGTSGVVEPAASFGRAARRRGAFLLEINLEPTPLTTWADRSLQGPVEVLLPGLL